MAPVRILGISGSLRRGSHNTSLLLAAAQSLPPDVELEIYDQLGALPHYNEDLDVDPAPEPAAALRAAIASADGLLIATPEYNGSVPGALKNAIDWASRPFPGNALAHKPVAVMGASTGIFGAVWAQAEIRKALKTAGAHVLDHEVPIGEANRAFTEQGQLADPALASALEELLEALVSHAATPAIR